MSLSGDSMSMNLEDEHGIVLRAQRLGHGSVRIHNAVGGRDLTRDQAKQLRDWLDDGDTAVRVHENDRLRAELKGIREDIGLLLESLKGAWWLDAAAAYGRLSDWRKRNV